MDAPSLPPAWRLPRRHGGAQGGHRLAHLTGDVSAEKTSMRRTGRRRLEIE